MEPGTEKYTVTGHFIGLAVHAAAAAVKLLLLLVIFSQKIVGNPPELCLSLRTEQVPRRPGLIRAPHVDELNPAVTRDATNLKSPPPPLSRPRFPPYGAPISDYCKSPWKICTSNSPLSACIFGAQWACYLAKDVPEEEKGCPSPPTSCCF